MPTKKEKKNYCSAGHIYWVYCPLNDPSAMRKAFNILDVVKQG